jgi:hypothetical protein
LNESIEDEEKESKSKMHRRALLDREDWEDPEHRKVLSEYHKEGLDVQMAKVEEELDSFEKHWKETAYKRDLDLKEYPPETKEEEIDEELEEDVISRPIDTATMEIIAYALFRSVFGRGVRIPIKRPGFVDMDIEVRGKDVTINTNELYYAMPELAVWRISYTHKGRTIAEFGRGIKKGFKINILNAIALFFEVWKMGKQNRKKATYEVKEDGGGS